MNCGIESAAGWACINVSPSVCYATPGTVDSDPSPLSTLIEMGGVYALSSGTSYLLNTLVTVTDTVLIGDPADPPIILVGPDPSDGSAAIRLISANARFVAWGVKFAPTVGFQDELFLVNAANARLTLVDSVVEGFGAEAIEVGLADDGGDGDHNVTGFGELIVSRTLFSGTGGIFLGSPRFDLENVAFVAGTDTSAPVNRALRIYPPPCPTSRARFITVVEQGPNAAGDFHGLGNATGALQCDLATTSNLNGGGGVEFASFCDPSDAGFPGVEAVLVADNVPFTGPDGGVGIEACAPTRSAFPGADDAGLNIDGDCGIDATNWCPSLTACSVPAASGDPATDIHGNPRPTTSSAPQSPGACQFTPP